MLPFLVSRPPLAQKVGTSPPQNRYGTSMASALATSPYLSCAFSCFSIRSWNVSALRTRARRGLWFGVRAPGFGVVFSLMLVSLSLFVNQPLQWASGGGVRCAGAARQGLPPLAIHADPFGVKTRSAFACLRPERA